MVMTPPSRTAPDTDPEPQRLRIRVRKRRRQRRRSLAVLGALLLLGLLGGLSVIPALQARNQLAQGKTALESGRSLLLAGDAEAAHASFTEALDHFLRASSFARNPILVAEGWLPIIGHTPETVRGLTEASEEVARAGVTLSDALNAIPGGIGGLSPSRDRVPVAMLTQLAGGVEDAARQSTVALEILRATPGSLLLGPVAEARALALDQVSALDRSFRTAATLLRELPPFLGAGGERRVLFAAQNPAEIRGTGGYLGAYSLLHLNDGRFAFSDFRPMEDIRVRSPGQIAPPNREYRQIYSRYGGPGFLPNVNMTPDFPSAAQGIEATYAKAVGVQLDGVIVADPFALRAMLQTTGPVQIPDLGISLDADNVVAFTTNEAYAIFADSRKRKLVLGSAAQAVLARFLSTGDPAAKIRAIGAMVGGGHLLVYSDDPKLEDALIASGAGGALEAPAGDYLSVVTNNGGGNKLDYYLDRSVTYSVRLGADGASSAEAAVKLTNHTPLDAGLPQYVVGPSGDVSAAGENVSFVALYYAPSGRVTNKSMSGADRDLGNWIERGIPFTWDYVRVASGESAALHYTLASDGTWTGDASGGTYDLRFQNQTTINQTRLRVEITVPVGMQVSSTNVPMEVHGQTAVWDGIPGRILDLEVSFQAPLATRVWNGIWDFLTRPVA